MVLTGGNFVSQGTFSTVDVDILIIVFLAASAWDAVNCPTIHGQLPTTKNDPAPHVNSAEVEKSCPRVMETLYILAGYMGVKHTGQNPSSCLFCFT